MQTASQPASIEKVLPLDAPATRRALQRVVAAVTTQQLWHEDLVQEALIHLWKLKGRRPGQRAVWYLRSCQYYLLNLMRHGRSVDSPKRRTASSVSLNGHDAKDEWPGTLCDALAATSNFENVVARDLVSVLDEWLTPTERDILACLASGHGMRETARQLKLSHACVAKKRRRIATLVYELAASHRSGRLP